MLNKTAQKFITQSRYTMTLHLPVQQKQPRKPFDHKSEIAKTHFI